MEGAEPLPRLSLSVLPKLSTALTPETKGAQHTKYGKINQGKTPSVYAYTSSGPSICPMQRSPARAVILTGTIRPQNSGPQPTMTGV